MNEDTSPTLCPPSGIVWSVTCPINLEFSLIWIALPTSALPDTVEVVVIPIADAKSPFIYPPLTEITPFDILAYSTFVVP